MKYEALHFQSVSVEDYKYGGILDATFTLYKGETVLLAGLFNSGIKTLINLLAGAANGFAGQIFAEGKELHTITFETMRRSGIAVIGKRPLLFENISFKDNLSLLKGNGHIFAVIPKLKFSEDVSLLIKILEIDFKTGCMEGLTPFEKIKLDILKSYLAETKIMVFTDLAMRCTEAETLKIVEIIKFLNARGVSAIVEIINEDTRYFCDVADRCIVFRNGLSATILYKNKQGNFDEEKLRYIVVGKYFTRKTKTTQMVPPLLIAKNRGGITIKNLKTGALYETQAARLVGIFDEHAQIPSTMEAFIQALNNMFELSIDGTPILVKEPIDFVRNKIAILPNESIQRMVFYNLSPIENVCFFAQPLFGGRFIYNWNTADYLFDKVTARHKILKHCAELKTRKDCHALPYDRLFELMIAKWLAINPKIVIMFSPLYNVDIKNAERFRVLQEELVGMGKTVFLISPDYEKLQNDCSEIFYV